MESLATSGIVFACVFGGAFLGMFVRSLLPEHHSSSDSKEVVKQVMGIVGVMTGMVLGLLVASAKSSFDGQRDGVTRLAANVVVLDRALEHFGPEAQDARRVLRDSATDLMRRIWAAEHTSASPAPASEPTRYDELYDRILALQPKTDAQRTTHAQALKVIHDTTQMRWLLYSQRSNSIPPVLLALMVAWLAILFASYTLFAPWHATTLAALFLGALVVSSAVFLILELDHSFGGVIHISSEPMRNALSQLIR